MASKMQILGRVLGCSLANSAPEGGREGGRGRERGREGGSKRCWCHRQPSIVHLGPQSPVGRWEGAPHCPCTRLTNGSKCTPQPQPFPTPQATDITVCGSVGGGGNRHTPNSPFPKGPWAVPGLPALSISVSQEQQAVALALTDGYGPKVGQSPVP